MSVSSKRGLHINNNAIYADAINRSRVEEQLEEVPPVSHVGFKPKFKVRGQASMQESRAVEHQPVKLGQKSGLFASEVEAQIASKRLENKIREAALKRVGAL